MKSNKVLILLFIILALRFIIGDPEASYYNKPKKEYKKSTVSDNVVNDALRNFRARDNFEGDQIYK